MDRFATETLASHRTFSEKYPKKHAISPKTKLAIMSLFRVIDSSHVRRTTPPEIMIATFLEALQIHQKFSNAFHGQDSPAWYNFEDFLEILEYLVSREILV